LQRRGLIASTNFGKEIDMRDEIFDREYQQGRDALNDGIDRAIASIARFVTTTGRAIHAFEFDAPWLKSERSKPAKRVKRVRAA
jgi:hypothetical protein